MKRMPLIVVMLLFVVGMSSCSIFKKCDCPKFNYLDEEVRPLEEEVTVFEAVEACEEDWKERTH
ncbi:MAG: hypothetical protein ACPG49_03100 [Chitinophagales bacterium]